MQVTVSLVHANMFTCINFVKVDKIDKKLQLAKVYLFSFYSKTKNAKDTAILQSLLSYHYISISPLKGTLPFKCILRIYHVQLV